MVIVVLRSTLVLFIFTWNFGPAQVHIYYTVEHVSIRYGITSTEFGKQQQHRIHIYSIITVCGGNDSPLLRNAIIIARGEYKMLNGAQCKPNVITSLAMFRWDRIQWEASLYVVGG